LSEVRANTISAANGTDPVTLTKQSAAKAFGRYSLPNSNVLYETLNISSLTDNGTGDGYFNFTNNFNISQIAAVAASQNTGSYTGGMGNGTTTSSARINTFNIYASGNSVYALVDADGTLVVNGALA
tara:strand:+ start:208 stop:588 length:381 start_codon:yes stop_codon:yes gene_type:complete